MTKNVIVTKDDNQLTIVTKGLGLNVEPSFFQAIQDAWDEGYRLPTEINRHNASYRVFKGAIKGRCIMFKEVVEEKVVVDVPVKEEVKVEADVVVDVPKQKVKPATKKTSPAQKKNK